MTKSKVTKGENSTVKFSLEITPEAIKKAQEKVIANAQKNMEISGFRKGHAPRETVIQKLGIELIQNATNEAINTEYVTFLTENKIDPIAPPKLNFPQKDEPKPGESMKVEFEVEVFPEVDFSSDYKKLKIKKVKVDIKDAEIDDVILTALSQTPGGAKSVKRAAKKGDIVVIDFEGTDKDGKNIPKATAKDQTVRLGMGHFLEDLEKGIVGMKPGEEKEKVEVNFPADYHAKEIAGAKTTFSVKLNDVQELSATGLSEEVIESLSGQKISEKELRDMIKQNVGANRVQKEEKESVDAFNKELAAIVQTEVPLSWTKAEVDARLANVKNTPGYKKDPKAFWNQIKQTEEQLTEEFQQIAGEQIRTYLGLTEIVKREKIELTEEEQGNIATLAKQEATKKGVDPKEEIHRAALNLKIDKYIRSLMA